MPLHEYKACLHRLCVGKLKIRPLTSLFLSSRPGCADSLRDIQPAAGLRSVSTPRVLYTRLSSACRSATNSADAGPDAFFAVASRCLREILVEHARARAALTVNSVLDCLTIIELGDGLNELALIEPRMSQAIELHCFAGPGKEQIAGTLDIEPAIVSRELRFAEAWLKRRLSQ
jgi:hypothetical protein